MAPKFKPLAIHKMTGSKHAKYERGNEPIPSQGEPERPRNLSDKELEVYDETVEKLRHMGVLAITDGATLERYAATTVRYWTNAEFIRERGDFFMRDGNIHQYPQVALVNQLGAALLKMEQEFGLTPCSRPKIQMEKTQLENKSKAKFFE